jgi:phosphate-selective porin OprO/OprP
MSIVDDRTESRQAQGPFKLVASLAMLTLAAVSILPATSLGQTPLPSIEVGPAPSSTSQPPAIPNFQVSQTGFADRSAMTSASPTPYPPQPLPELPGFEDAASPSDAGEQTISLSATEFSSVMQRLDALEKEAAKSAGAADKGAKTDKADKGKAGEKKEEGWVDLSSEKWTVKLGGHVQMDYVQWANASPGIPDRNYFEFRRLRLMADGTGYGQYDFRLQMDIEPESGDGVATPVVDVKDAYLTANDWPVVQRWRIGNFFVPFGLEQVTNDTQNIFLERSIPTQNIFTADREVGMATYGVNDTKDVTWTFGVFFDRISESLKEKIDDNQGTRVSGRLTWLPYYDEPSNGRYLVHTGMGVLYTDNFDGLSRFRARPQVHEGPFLIDSGLLPSENYTVGNIELATVWGPASIQSELFATNVNLDTGDNANLYGYYVYGSYFLTGENRIYERYGQHGAQFGRTVPYTNFFMVPGCVGSGAWEAKVRTSYLDLEQVGGGQYQDITAGFNWYWSDRIRVMFDWIHPFTTADTTFGTTESDLIGMRFDFNW